MAVQTMLPSDNCDRSTQATGPSCAFRRSWAKFMAMAVLPMPPAPTIVTRGCWSSKAWSSASSPWRPNRVVERSAAVARAALDLGFYISFSGILTFRNAAELRDVARFVPLDRCLIETDSPYLAPMPHRGRTNNPSYVAFVAEQLAELRQCPVQAVAEATSTNFERLFRRVTEPQIGAI